MAILFLATLSRFHLDCLILALIFVDLPALSCFLVFSTSPLATSVESLLVVAVTMSCLDNLW
jgi:hypothetical protein